MSTKTKTANGNEHEFAFGHPAVAYRSDFLMLLEAWFDSRAGLRDVFIRPCFHEIAVAGLGVRLKDRRTSAERVDEWRSQRRARALAIFNAHGKCGVAITKSGDLARLCKLAVRMLETIGVWQREGAATALSIRPKPESGR